MTKREEERRFARELRVKGALLLRTHEAALVCGVSDDTFRRRIQPNLTPRYLTRRCRMWRRAEIDAFLSGLAQSPEQIEAVA